MKDQNFSALVKESIEIEEKRMEEERQNTKKIFDFMEFRKKLKRNFFAGFGLGLILAAAALWLFQPKTQIEEQKEKEKIASDMRNAEIIEAAKSLGMVFPEELNQNDVGIDESNN